MTKTWEDFLTEDGKHYYEFFKKHELGIFYDPMMGNLQIPKDDWEEHVIASVLEFIAEYWEQQWVLTYNDDCEMWFVYQVNED